KPALSRGEIQTIGATTLDEYRKYIEKDGALERRFQPVIVKAPTVPQAIEIIRGLRHKYEAHHRVKITERAISAAVQLADRYITDRHLPDKAIDVIDEAPSRRSRERSGGPARASRTPSAPSAPSCSWGRPVSARPSSPGRSPSTCSVTRTP